MRGTLNIIKKTYNSFMNTEKNGFEDAKGFLKEKGQTHLFTSFMWMLQLVIIVQ